jgi:hypothetical protein
MKYRRAARQIRVDAEPRRLQSLVAAAVTVAADALCRSPLAAVLHSEEQTKRIKDTLITRAFIALGLSQSTEHAMLTEGLRMLAKGAVLAENMRACLRLEPATQVLQALRDGRMSCDAATIESAPDASAPKAVPDLAAALAADPDSEVPPAVRSHPFFAAANQIVAATTAVTCFQEPITGVIRYEQVTPWEKAFRGEMTSLERCTRIVHENDPVPATADDAPPQRPDTAQPPIVQSHRAVLLDGVLGKETKCWPGGSSPDISKDYLYRGIYLRQLQRLHAAFGRDRVLVLRQVDLQRNQEATLARVLAFVGLPPNKEAPPAMTAQATEDRWDGHI